MKHCLEEYIHNEVMRHQHQIGMGIKYNESDDVIQQIYNSEAST